MELTILDTWHNKKWIEKTDDQGNVWGMKYDFYDGQNNIQGVNASTTEGWVDPSGPAFAYQKALVQKVVASLGHHPNLMWEVANEAPVEILCRNTFTDRTRCIATATARVLIPA